MLCGNGLHLFDDSRSDLLSGCGLFYDDLLSQGLSIIDPHRCGSGTGNIGTEIEHSIASLHSPAHPVALFQYVVAVGEILLPEHVLAHLLISGVFKETLDLFHDILRVRPHTRHEFREK